MYINEDYIVDFVKKNNGIIFSRTYNNATKQNINKVNNFKKPTFVCLTGYNHIIQQFFNNILGYFKNKIILICIESDIINFTNEQINNKQIQHIYTWNKTINHPKITCIPIGINFKRHYFPIITFISNYKPKYNNNLKLLCYNCNLNTNIERSKINIDFMEKLPYIKPIESKIISSYIEGKLRVDITDSKCYNNWCNYKFILSPPGAGLDCHRTWESIIINICHNNKFNINKDTQLINKHKFIFNEPICIPIVLSNSINEIYKDLPVLIVDSYDLITKEFLQLKYEKMMNKTYNIEPIYMNYLHKQLIDEQQKNNYKIHFCTYANEKYKKAKERIINEARNFNEFTLINEFGPESLTKEFKEKYSIILNMEKGGGYWIWKIDIIKQMLNKINNNEFLLYMDAGCKFNVNGKNKFYEYIEKLNNSEFGIMSFQMKDQPENKWTTKEIFKYFNHDENDTTGQYVGGVLLMKKCDHLIEYLNDFEKCINDNPLLITDIYNNNQNYYFSENRHDQSISSIIRKKNGSLVIDNDETFIIPFGSRKSMMYPFWAIRSKK
jgi:hypothetical protein